MNAPYTTLIDVDQLAGHLGDAGWVVIDCRFTLSEPLVGVAAYQKSRVPGARYADLERELSGPKRPGSSRNPLPEPSDFAATLSRWGVTPASQVVVYDDSFGSIACRLWWLLRQARHPKVALLDGGWPVWKRRKLPIEDSAPAGDPALPTPYPLHPAATLVADTALVEAIRLDPNWALIDARPEERYSGQRETVDAVGGHIPGSRPWTFEDNLAFDGRFLSAAELRDNFSTLLAAVPPSQVVHTCGSGVTACHNVLAMEHAGLAGSRLYAGSWSQWISDPARPVATGTD